MAIDQNIQQYISTFVQNQFPRFYEEYGQGFIDFVVAYYQWMETQGPLYDSRRAASYQDIDTTVSKFLVYFKDKYLQNIPLGTNSNVGLLVKHSLDVYRSRGTPRSVDLLFRLVYGTGADVYYPYDDVFRLSAAEWIIPRYIEVSTQDDLNKFVGKEIIGVTSQAQAFVDSWIRKKSGSKQIDILYISVIAGTFVTGERINTMNSPYNLLSCPTVIGSLSQINVTSGGTGFTLGQILPVMGVKGYGAKARVANVAQTAGLVSFTLNDGGYGYTANSQVLVSQEVLSLSSVIPGASQIGKPNFFSLFETISQPMANINYTANTGLFSNNDTIYEYAANGSVLGSGLVLSAASGGQLFVAVLSGNLQSNSTFYNQTNSVSASIAVSNGYVDRTATGNVMSESASATLIVSSNLTSSFLVGETITGGNNTSATIVTVAPGITTTTLTIKNRVGAWAANAIVKGAASGTTAALQQFSMSIGVINCMASFIAEPRATLKTSLSLTTAQLPVKNQGSGASFQISNTMLYPETISLNSDMISPYLTTPLNSNNYGFPPAGAETLSTVIGAALSTTSYTVGRISSLVATTPGTGYTLPPMIRVYEPLTFNKFKIKDWNLYLTGTTAPFTPGDLVQQTATGARGLITFANSSFMRIQRMSLNNDFTTTSNSATLLSSNTSAVTANITFAEPASFTIPEDLGATYLGMNADISGNTVSANGSITSLQVINSGWGYEPGETLTVTANGVTATGQAVILQQGTGSGFYRTQNGFLSDNKKLHDNDYYQVSSYDIRASVAFDTYKDMLYSLLHVAGTKAFGTYVHRATTNTALTIRSAIVRNVTSDLPASINAAPLGIGIQAQAGLIIPNPGGQSAGAVATTAAATGVNPFIMMGAQANASVGGAVSFPVLLMHFNAANGATTFTDTSSKNHTFSLFTGSNSYISTAQSKFGGSSLYVPSTSDGIRGTGASDLALGTGNFVLDFWIYSLGSSSIGMFDWGTGGPTLSYGDPSIGGQGINWSGIVKTFSTLSANIWIHIAVVRSSGSVKVFVNGVQSGTTGTDTTNYGIGANAPWIGNLSSQSQGGSAYYDEIRLTLGTDLGWFNGFTPPTSQY